MLKDRLAKLYAAVVWLGAGVALYGTGVAGDDEGGALRTTFCVRWGSGRRFMLAVEVSC